LVECERKEIEPRVRTITTLTDAMKFEIKAACVNYAMEWACMLAEKGDVILVAGKGHENYQEIKGVKHHFDDKEVLKEIFK
jgi:UDP-N-acetylmuramoyl-L-alanyl-D-glutamate--2,6-diaminopimelate ligase